MAEALSHRLGLPGTPLPRLGIAAAARACCSRAPFGLGRFDAAFRTASAQHSDKMSACVPWGVTLKSLAQPFTQSLRVDRAAGQGCGARACAGRRRRRADGSRVQRRSIITCHHLSWSYIVGGLVKKLTGDPPPRLSSPAVTPPCTHTPSACTTLWCLTPSVSVAVRLSAGEHIADTVQRLAIRAGSPGQLHLGRLPERLWGSAAMLEPTPAGSLCWAARCGLGWRLLAAVGTTM